MSPLTTQKFINAAYDERVASMREEVFGASEIGGDPNWTAPIHGSTSRGKPVTVSLGQGKRAGHTLACDEHVDMRTFYAKAGPGKGHDHYLTDGKPAGGRDRGRFSE